MSFYDWYCDLPPASPQTWGEQTDVPESADWYNSNFIIAWGSNVPQTRTPDAHFFTEVRYKGAKVVAVDITDGSYVNLGIGMPAQGTVKLSELAGIVGPRQQPVLRDLYFRPTRTLSEYTRLAKRDGAIPD